MNLLVLTMLPKKVMVRHLCPYLKAPDFSGFSEFCFKSVHYKEITLVVLAAEVMNWKMLISMLISLDLSMFFGAIHHDLSMIYVQSLAEIYCDVLGSNPINHFLNA